MKERKKSLIRPISKGDWRARGKLQAEIAGKVASLSQPSVFRRSTVSEAL